MSIPTPFLKGSGPLNAKIVIVTEFATADDLWRGHPLAGTAGDLFGKLLNEAHIIRASCRLTSVLKTRVKGDSTYELFTQNKALAGRLRLHKVLAGTYIADELLAPIEALHAEIAALQPTVIIALGNLAMFALTEVYGSVDTWRGSHLAYVRDERVTVIPTYTPQDVMKRWEVKGFCVRDLQRAQSVARAPELYVPPAYKFQIRPTFVQVQTRLQDFLLQLQRGELWLSVDIETVARNMSCIGLAWNAREALCIPMLTLGGNYWQVEEEVQIQLWLKEILTHRNVRVIGQNFNYDAQYFARFLGYLPRLAFDTMIAQHTLFPGLPKALDFLSSIYCHWHRYWKDELNDYSRLPANLDQYWSYNCKDCVTTFEITRPLQNMLEYYERTEQYELLHQTGQNALVSMLRGMRIDRVARSAIAEELMQTIAEYERLIHTIVGFPLNVNSPQQMAQFFYEQLKLPVQRDRKTGQPTLSAKVLPALIKAEPLVGALLELIERKRSIGVFLKTFCMMPLSEDGRMRCSFNVCGTETFRFSSSTDAFGTGGNLQNIPKGEEE